MVIDDYLFLLYRKIYLTIFFLDVIAIEKTGENFRLLYDAKGRFTIHRITAEEASVSISKAEVSKLRSGNLSLSFY